MARGTPQGPQRPPGTLQRLPWPIRCLKHNKNQPFFNSCQSCQAHINTPLGPSQDPPSDLPGTQRYPQEAPKAPPGIRRSPSGTPGRSPKTSKGYPSCFQGAFELGLVGSQSARPIRARLLQLARSLALARSIRSTACPVAQLCSHILAGSHNHGGVC